MNSNKKEIWRAAKSLNRRAFLSWTGLGWLTTVLVGLVGDRTSEAQPVGNFQTVGTLTQLEQGKGQLATQVNQKPVVVIRDPNQPKNLIALNQTCTHRGCKVNWQPEARQFVCPCHNSRFSSSGDVVKGPAKKPLSRYTVRVEGQNILVKS